MLKLLVRPSKPSIQIFLNVLDVQNGKYTEHVCRDFNLFESRRLTVKTALAITA